MRSPNWTRDELILALDLYFRAPEARTDASHSEVIKLSKKLRSMPLHPLPKRPDNFRNENSIAMKLRNFVSLDNDGTSKGLKAGAQLEIEVWETYSTNTKLLETTSDAINDALDSYDSEADNPLDFEISVKEGKLLFRSHLVRERSKSIVKKKKELTFYLTGALACEVCEFDFYKIYGELGRKFAECHHATPLSELRNQHTTKLSDLHIVCANCHRMIHRSKKWLTIEELKQQLLS